MFHTLTLAVRSLTTRPSRTALTAFGIVLGVAVILAISITNLSALASITTLFNEASGKAQLVVTSSDLNERGFSEGILHRIASTPGVQSAVPTLQIQTLLTDEPPPAQLGMSFFGQVFGGLVLYGIDPVLDPEAREYKIVAGRFLSDDLNAYEVVLVQNYAEDREIEVGTDVEIYTPGGAERLRVVGLMSKEGPGQLNQGAFGILPLTAAQEAFGRRGDLDQIDIVAAPEAAGGDDLARLKATLQARLGEAYSVVYPASRGERVTQMLDVYQLGLQFFSVIALFVGAFLIYNAFSMTVVERTREIGMLRTLGMTRGQVMRQVLTEALILGIVGAALGVGVGILLSRGLIRITELLLSQEVREVQLPVDGLVTSVVVGVCVALVAALIPAWQAGRISPLDALRARGIRPEPWIVRSGWPLGVALLAFSYLALFERLFAPEIQYQLGRAAVFLIFVGATLLIPATIGAWERVARPVMRRIYGSEGRLGSGNIQRARLRTTLTVAALMVGAAMILGIRGMTNAFEHDIQDWIEVYIGGDLVIHSTLPLRTDLGPRLAAVKGVAAATPIRFLEIEWVRPDGDEERLLLTGIEPASHQRVTSFVFATNQGEPDLLLNRLVRGDEVFVSSVLSEKYGLQQGDQIRLKTRRGQRTFEVAAVVVDYNNQGMVIHSGWRDLRRYFRVDDVSMFLVKLDPGESLDEVADRIDRQHGKRYRLTIESNKAMKGRALRLTAQTFSLFDVLAVIGMVVAGLGVVNTLTMNVLERTQEIGMLRGIGMTRRQVGKMVLAEAGMMGLIGGAFGLLFGLLLSRVLLMAVNEMEGYALAYVLPTQGILVSLVIALIVSQAAAVWPARRAARMRIIDAIQFE